MKDTQGGEFFFYLRYDGFSGFKAVQTFKRSPGFASQGKINAPRRDVRCSNALAKGSVISVQTRNSETLRLDAAIS